MCLVVALLGITIAITLAILLPRNTTTKSNMLPFEAKNELSAVLAKPSMNPSLRWKSTAITIAGIAGVAGNNASLLFYPYGSAFDSSNNLYFADYFNHRIQKLIFGTSTIVTAIGSSNGTAGNTSKDLNLPVDVLFDANDDLYITDRGNNRVQFWPKGATSGTTVAGRK